MFKTPLSLKSSKKIQICIFLTLPKMISVWKAFLLTLPIWIKTSSLTSKHLLLIIGITLKNQLWGNLIKILALQNYWLNRFKANGLISIFRNKSMIKLKRLENLMANFRLNKISSLISCQTHQCRSKTSGCRTWKPSLRPLARLDIWLELSQKSRISVTLTCSSSYQGQRI